jgi:hypothetical protein
VRELPPAAVLHPTHAGQWTRSPPRRIARFRYLRAVIVTRTHTQRPDQGSLVLKPEAGFEPATRPKRSSFAGCRLEPLDHSGKLTPSLSLDLQARPRTGKSPASKAGMLPITPPATIPYRRLKPASAVALHTPNSIGRRCPPWDSNPHGHGSKPCASTNWAKGASI